MNTVADFMNAVGSIATEAASMAQSVMTTAISNPVILTFLAVPLCGIGIGFAKRLLKVGR